MLSGGYAGVLTIDMPSDVASMSHISKISGARMVADTVRLRVAYKRRGQCSPDASCPGSLPWTAHCLFPVPQLASALLFRAAQKGSLARPQGV
jgi:hypothetical protein